MKTRRCRLREGAPFRVSLFSMLAVAAVLMTVPGLVLADSISPTTFTATGPTGFTSSVNKTVTVSAGRPTTSLVDVFFLADTTGSMGDAIDSVKTAAITILTSTAGLGNVAFAVGEYKDVGDTFPGGGGPVFKLDQALTTTQALVQTGINAWLATGGGDLPEGNLFGLQQVGNTTPWRAGSARVLVWFGDAPGHDPRNGATEGTATAALTTNNVKVEAINITSTGPAGGLNAACGGTDCTAGQANRITTATGGQVFNTIDPTAVATVIQNAITAAFATYSSVCLSPVGNGAAVSVAFSPVSGCITGTFDRSIDRTFTFNNVTFTDNTPGVHSFVINATVDGGIVATETDTINSTGGDGGVVPEPASVLLLGSGLFALAAFRRKFSST